MFVTRKTKLPSGKIIEMTDHAYYCRTIMTYDGKNICMDLFGELEDLDPSSADDHDCGCGDMHFTPYRHIPEELRQIMPIEDFIAIGDLLEDMLSFGHCSYCS